jgi:hypothetical protein
MYKSKGAMKMHELKEGKKEKTMEYGKSKPKPKPKAKKKKTR